MKKTFITMLLCSVFSMSMMAQSTKTIKGAVIDKNGNPLPGAMVEATGGAESTTVDADGTFSMEVPVWLKSATAKYAGMKNKTMKVKNSDMIFRMSPKTGGWFVNAVGAIEVGETEGNVGRLGVMGGKLSKWGYYGKFMYSVGEEIEEGGVVGTVGVIKSINTSSNVLNTYIYLGAGYGSVYHENKHNHDYRFIYKDGVALETGAILNYKHLNFNVGCGFSTVDDINLDIMFGLGYRF